jgi:AcrR family transcriptional regulator
MDQSASAIIGVFAQYGFRKTAMEDVAKAAGKSRQALYNRFGSKEAVFTWAVDEIAMGSAQAASAALADTGASLEERLLNAFDAWAGQHVDLLRASPHGGEVIAAAKADTAARAAQAEAQLAREIAALLVESGKAADQAAADDAAVALASASKGLLYTARSREDYQATLKRVIRALVR